MRSPYPPRAFAISRRAGAATTRRRAGRPPQSANAVRQDDHDTVAAKIDRRDDADGRERRLLEADRGTAPPAANLGGDREGEAVPAHCEAGRHDERRNEDPVAARHEHGDERRAPRQRRPRPGASGGCGRRMTSDQRPIADPQHRSEPLPDREDRRPRRRPKSRARRGGRGRESPSARPARRCRTRSRRRRSRADGRARSTRRRPPRARAPARRGGRVRRRARRAARSRPGRGSPRADRPAPAARARPPARRQGPPSAGRRARSPRCDASNQRITARPLPDCTLPPVMPADASSTNSVGKLGAYAAPARQAAQAVSPTVSVQRSP